MFLYFIIMLISKKKLICSENIKHENLKINITFKIDIKVIISTRILLIQIRPKQYETRQH